MAIPFNGHMRPSGPSNHGTGRADVPSHDNRPEATVSGQRPSVQIASDTSTPDVPPAPHATTKPNPTAAVARRTMYASVVPPGVGLLSSPTSNRRCAPMSVHVPPESPFNFTERRNRHRVPFRFPKHGKPCRWPTAYRSVHAVVPAPPHASRSLPCSRLTMPIANLVAGHCHTRENTASPSGGGCIST